MRNATSREKVGTLKEVLRKKVSSEKYPNENNTASVGDLQGNKKKGYASSTEIGTGEDDKLLISSSNIQPFQRLANIPIVIVEGIFAQGQLYVLVSRCTNGAWNVRRVICRGIVQ